MEKFFQLCNQIAVWCFGYVGSSRSSALLRIGLGVIIWSRFTAKRILCESTGVADVAFFISFFLFSTMMLIGWYARISSFITAMILFCFHYGVIGEQMSSHHIHLLCIATLICSFTPCGHSYSLDRYLFLKKGVVLPEKANLWGLRLLSLQVSIMYFCTAFNKTTVSFLSGEQMERIIMSCYTGSDLPTFLGFHGAMVIIGWGTVLLEYVLAFGLLFKKTRRYLLLPGMVFHAFLAVLLPVRVFTVLMWVLYLSYVDADRVHQEIAFLETEKLGNRSASLTVQP